jgi:organic radical activating enzyme
MSIIDEIKYRFFTRHEPIKTGVYHYQAPPDAEFPYRLHLRIEKNGAGILILNASTVLHLNQTAAEFAYHLVNQTPENDIVKQVVQRYRIQQEQALQDYRDFQENLQTLIEMPDLDPVTFLGFDRTDPYSEEIQAPYRLDCALTYQVIDQGSSLAAPKDRVVRELTSEEWKKIIYKTWEAGIPHLIFTGGEPTIRPDLIELIAYAEELGQVTGLLTGGYRLVEPDYLEKLLVNGLDHIMIVLRPDDDLTWEALRDTLKEDIFVTVHITLSNNHIDQHIALVDRLKEMGVESISLSINDVSLQDTLNKVRQEVEYRNISLIWDIPVPYSALNPVNLELEAEDIHISGEGYAWLYVEPDGDVLTRQGKPAVLGNLLNDPWQQIWTSAVTLQQKSDG